MAIYGYTKNYKLIKPQFNTDTWHDYIYDNLDTIDAVMSAIYASGNWKGFWATNTVYTVGDVIIDQNTDTMYKVMVDHTTSETTFAEEFAAHTTYYELWSPNNLAEDWAIKMDDVVSNTDYSSKAYAISSGLIDAGSAKEWAVGSGEVGDTGEYSAKKYATDAHNDYISLTTDVNVVAVGTNINNVNAVGQSISNVNTVASDISSVNTVAGVSTDVTTVASIATAVSTVSDIESEVLDVSDNRTDISTVASNISDVNTVAGISTDVSTVADNDANVSTVATNISDVNTAATNIAAIQEAPTAASNAAASATLAQEWATKMDGQVESTDYSSKYYAGQAANSASYAAGVEANIHSIVDDAAQTLSEMLNTPFFFGQSMYSENAPYNASWLASNGSYNAASVYPDLWTQLTGVELNGSLNVGDTIEIGGKTYVKRGLPVVLSTGTITDYDFVVNQNDQTFRLPLLNGEEDLPGDKYEDLTLQATGSTYTAPANGWYAINKHGTASQLAAFENGTAGNITWISSLGSETDARISVPVKKGDVVKLWWNTSGTTNFFRFIYAKGNGTLYYYIGDTVQDASLINAGAVLGQLSNKADIDASNFNADGKSLLSGLGYPSDRYDDLTVLVSDSNYTAPANGWFNTRWNSSSSTLHFIQFRDGANTQIRDIRYYSTTVGSVAVISTYARKGQQIKMRYDGASSECEYFRFYYAEGETNV